MDVLEIKGKVNTAICYARVVEDEAIEQIRRMCDYSMTEGSKIRIMPDVHAGKGCTIGTTMTIKDKAVPNVVGVDIGCGMYTMNLGKGAIAAHAGERVLIPINMRDGSVLAVGKGNPEWNFSAPHGAGRLMSRSKAKETLSLDEYKETMKGIYTTSINENTLDEAPMAYKSLEDIIDVIKESVDVIDVMKPIYNFKASD
jgi:RNA-splicing ligase RtcB